MLDNEMLVFSRENLLTEEPLGNKYRKGETFTKDFLTMTFEKPLIILLIQDDATKFKVKKPYDEKIGEIHYVVTAPEIEMLMIIHKRLQDRYKKQKKKPSIFLAEHEKKSTAKIKSSTFIRSVFTQETLIAALIEYNRITKNDENLRLIDLVKSELK
ncbi:hypothetical protein BAU16_03965 [Enterococcus sp. JM9B]|nr:hypothetical protein BAU16_03965 [Enterococcus sp. JM9B]